MFVLHLNSQYTHYQVLKAISSTTEASAATPQPAVSPTQDKTLDTQSSSRSDKQSGDAAPLKSRSGQAQVETESEPADVVTLKQLMIEVRQFKYMYVCWAYYV